MQGIDDGSNWWLHSLLSYAYRPIHRQVDMISTYDVITMMTIGDDELERKF